MAFQIRGGEQKEHVADRDPDKGHPTVWILGTLDLRVRTYIQDETATFEVSSDKPTDRAGVRLRLGERNVLIVRFGLKGWRNLTDAQGQEVPFAQEAVDLDGKSYPVVARALLEALPYELIEELATAILRMNTLAEPDRKNSASR